MKNEKYLNYFQKEFSLKFVILQNNLLYFKSDMIIKIYKNMQIVPEKKMFKSLNFNF